MSSYGSRFSEGTRKFDSTRESRISGSTMARDFIGWTRAWRLRGHDELLRDLLRTRPNSTSGGGALIGRTLSVNDRPCARVPNATAAQSAQLVHASQNEVVARKLFRGRGPSSTGEVGQAVPQGVSQDLRQEHNHGMEPRQCPTCLSGAGLRVPML